MSRETKKPCPGCGQSNTGRAADKVCDKCRHAIDSWNQHVSKAHGDPSLETVLLKGAPHWYPEFYFGHTCSMPELSQVRSEISQLFFALGELICVEQFGWRDAPEDCRTRRAEGEYSYLFNVGLYKDSKGKRLGYPASSGSSTYDRVYGKIPGKLLLVVRRLWDRVARFAELAYLSGLTDGRDILLQLSSGEMSVQEFQEKDIELCRRKQNAVLLNQHINSKES